jgi:hypothetical protein
MVPMRDLLSEEWDVSTNDPAMAITAFAISSFEPS